MTSGRRWRPSAYRTAAYGLGAAGANALARVSDQGPFSPDGGLALLVLAAVFLVLVGLDLWFGEVLCADEDGLVVARGPRRRERLAWADVEHLGATSTTSRGLLRLSSLEIDLGERLIVLSRHRLGADPEVVADELRSLRAGG